MNELLEPLPMIDNAEAIELLAEEMLKRETIDLPLVHRFSPGLYLREIFMPAGSVVIGHEHKTEHFNIVLTGRASVLMNGIVEEIVAPCVFVSGAGVQKVLHIHEDMRWMTTHVTQETDLDKLQDDLVLPCKALENHKKELNP